MTEARFSSKFCFGHYNAPIGMYINPVDHEIGNRYWKKARNLLTDYQDGFKNRNLMSSFEYSIISHHLTSVFYQYKLIHS